ncbi:hypothetical protein [Paracoccus sp. JM45]|uniref:hypothetical protein n=1 Tax=Paracoccus sp. JM45 TaxID=2283626 RepID=UPI000E6B503B|nr:hypothetical protein [Paracoccus sp. JM45]RJE79714.1 hypothetical protein DWB67_11405 [Paracoccus sp. JM45]
MTAGIAAFAVVSGQAVRASDGIRCIVTFEGDMPIPEGQIEVVIENAGLQSENQPSALTFRMPSDGQSRQILFDLPLPVNIKTKSGVQIVAYLERKDGWLLARGSAEFKTTAPNKIELFTAIH